VIQATLIRAGAAESRPGPAILEETMSLFFVRHQHGPETCPAKDPQMGAMLLDHLNPQNARRFGVEVQSDAVLDNQHTLVMIVEAPGATQVENFMQPFRMAGEVEIWPASTCEVVVDRAGCETPV
jgi:hypothetical protein